MRARQTGPIRPGRHSRDGCRHDAERRLSRALAERTGGPRVVTFGDCHAPSIIATAVYAGHRFARTLTFDLSEMPDFLREDVAFASESPAQRVVATD